MSEASSAPAARPEAALPAAAGSPAAGGLPPRLISFYADDLTGATDAMEALSRHGLPTIVFLQRPSDAQMRRCGVEASGTDGAVPRIRAIGLAGTSRSRSPAWMDRHLPADFTWLRALAPAICHYKVCSTFDSAPEIGNIGRAIEIGARVFDQAMVPLVVGVPQLGRYTAFGTLFATYRGVVYRIDRHPVMSRHPVTPMDEADLRLHLGRQTPRSIGLVDLVALARIGLSHNGLARGMASEGAPAGEGQGAAEVDGLVEGHDIVLFDVADAASQAAVGAALWRLRRPEGLFVAGSSGIDYALLAAWRHAGLLDENTHFDPPGKVERLAVVSGSCSATTERQIHHAAAAGFVAVPLDPLELIGETATTAIEAAIGQGLAALRSGRSPILHTALGPATDRGRDIDAVAEARHAIGRALGQTLARLVVEQKLGRAIVAGGDTASHALAELNIVALETRLPLPRTPGSPLCRAFSDDAHVDGLEIALKGGQIGDDSYFCDIRDGRG